MRLIRRQAHARAGLLGNPSDGYGGKTISLIVPNYRAQVTLYEWDRIEVVFSGNDQTRFDSIDELVDDVRLHGYYGGIRLVKATIKKFAEYCRTHGHPLHEGNFSVRYESDVPRQVGMAGSSAIIVATLRCLMEFYGVTIPLEAQPSLALSVEREELGIAAGLQDRVIQVYEGVVYMDFGEAQSRDVLGYQCGRYEPLDVAKLPPVYIAYSTDASEPTEVVHNNLRARFEQGEPEVLAAMQQFAQFAEEGREAILLGDGERLARLIDANFDLRRSICPLPKAQVRMVETARAAGASAKFAGSGGAIVGTFADDETLDRLRTALREIGCCVLLPQL